MTALAEICHTPYQAAVFDALDRQYRPLKNAAKLLARHARTTPRTAENWLARQNAPRGDQLIFLMAHCDELEQEILRLVAQVKETIR